MTTDNQLANVQPQDSAPSSLSILERAVAGGITQDNVAVVKELLAMRREELAAANKADFNRAFFRLKTEIATLDFYADKTAKTKSGETAYTYCSEAEIASSLEPVLFRHGFAMLFGQRQDGDKIVVEVTLVHQSGHEEKREYSVRSGGTNAMKDATAADSGATTSAWRHLVIKLFGLKSRIRDDKDARLIGEPIDHVEAQYLREFIAEVGAKEAAILQMAGADSIESIGKNVFPVLIRALEMKKGATK